MGVDESEDGEGKEEKERETQTKTMEDVRMRMSMDRETRMCRQDRKGDVQTKSRRAGRRRPGSRLTMRRSFRHQVGQQAFG